MNTPAQRKIPRIPARGKDLLSQAGRGDTYRPRSAPHLEEHRLVLPRQGIVVVVYRSVGGTKNGNSIAP